MVTVATAVVSVSGLEYKGELVGLRIFTDDGAMDIGKVALKGIGIKQFDIENRVELIEVDNLLLSDEELQTGKLAVDISEDETALEWLKPILESDEYKAKLAGFQQPYEVSLYEFMSDEDWVPHKVEHRTDEHKNQHYMREPNGENYRGGWIGSYRSLDAAKKGFHENQVKYALHKGSNVADSSVQTYAGLKQAKETIELLQSRISFEGEVVFFEVDGVIKTFHIDDFPLTNRVMQRGYARNNGLIGSDITDAPSNDNWFSSQELVVIAIQKSISEYLK